VHSPILPKIFLKLLDATCGEQIHSEIEQTRDYQEPIPWTTMKSKGAISSIASRKGYQNMLMIFLSFSAQ
jgi:hypothetical protein